MFVLGLGVEKRSVTSIEVRQNDVVLPVPDKKQQPSCRPSRAHGPYTALLLRSHKAGQRLKKKLETSEEKAKRTDRSSFIIFNPLILRKADYNIIIMQRIVTWLDLF